MNVLKWFGGQVDHNRNMDNLPGSRYLRYWGPVLDALRDLGGSGTPEEVTERIVEALGISDDDRDQWHESGIRIVDSDIRWSRNSLKDAGLIDSSIRGVWRLTPKGQETTLSHEDSQQLLQELRVVRYGRRKAKKEKEKQKREVAKEANNESLDNDELSLLEVMMDLTPDGFERLCQRVLRESGFTEVIVTGKSGDGGIDGNGILKINELVSFHVLFQCKRYQGSVGCKAIRDFRGAMSGRTDKGIFLTTGTFTRDAVEEATRDGVTPIELVDGERLTELMQDLALGVSPRTVFDVDFKFFESYR